MLAAISRRARASPHRSKQNEVAEELMPTLTQPRRKHSQPRTKQENSEVAKILRQHAVLRWFAVISMLAIISWIFIDLFGPVPKYQLSQRPQAELNSPEFVRELEALAASRVEQHTQIEALPNGVNFYEAEMAALKSAKKRI